MRRVLSRKECVLRTVQNYGVFIRHTYIPSYSYLQTGIPSVNHSLARILNFHSQLADEVVNLGKLLGLTWLVECETRADVICSMKVLKL